MVKIHLFDDFKPGTIYKFAGNCIFIKRIFIFQDLLCEFFHKLKFIFECKKGTQNQAKRHC